MKIYKVREKYEKYLILLILLSLYFSLVETLIPKPFPWLKLGLANICTIIAFEKFGKKMAIEVLICRVTIQGIMLGTIFSPSFIISFLSGIASLFCLGFLYNFRDKLSITVISMVSAFVHNLTQLIIVYFLLFRDINLNTRYINLFIVGFLFLGCISGVLIGIICEKLIIRRIK